MIVLFGAGGQLGREIVRAAGAAQLDVAALDRAALDIADRAAVRASLEAIKPALAVNAAAYTKVDQAESDVDNATRVNAVAPAILAEECARVGIPLVHFSTDYVFDGRKQGAYREDDPIDPINIYGRTKAEGEQAVRAANDKHVILRTSWVYGEFGNNFLKTMVRLAKTQPELRIVADQTGNPTSTRDLAAAVLHIAPRLIEGDGVWGTYHLSGTGTTTWFGFAETVVAASEKVTGRKPPVTPIGTADFKTAARRPGNSALDCGKFAAAFGFRARPWQDEVSEIATIVAQAT